MSKNGPWVEGEMPEKADAFKAFLYEREDGGVEVVWNCRNEKAPKYILGRDGRNISRKDDVVGKEIPATDFVLAIVPTTFDIELKRLTHAAELNPDMISNNPFLMSMGKEMALRVMAQTASEAPACRTVLVSWNELRDLRDGKDVSDVLDLSERGIAR